MDLEPKDDSINYEGSSCSPEERAKINTEYSNHARKGAVRARYEAGEINESLFIQIENAKTEGFQMEVECNLESRKKKFNNEIKNLPPEEVVEAINDEIANLSIVYKADYNIEGTPLPLSPREKTNIKRGVIPDLSFLKGKDLTEIIKNHELMKSGSDFELTYFCHGSDRRAAYLCKKLLKEHPLTPEPDQFIPPESQIYPELIISDEIRKKLYDGLKHFFAGYEELLFKHLVEKEPIATKLPFSGQLNVFVELFQRLHYNGYIGNRKKEINSWIRNNFTFKHTSGEQTLFKEEVVERFLKGDCDSKKRTPPKNKRLCEDWANFKPYRQLIQENDF